MDQHWGNNKWNIFKARRLYFICINMSSLLPKIEELCLITCLSNVTLTESKLHNSIFDLEIEIDGYNILRFDRNRHGGEVACYAKNYFFKFHQKKISSKWHWSYFYILPKTKPMTVDIIYRPPSQANLLQTMNWHFYKKPTYLVIFI